MTSPRRRLFAHLLPPALALVLALPADATWSIVAVNRRTGEVAVGSATCLHEDLTLYVPCVVVGKGAGAAQSVVDPAARNRMIMFQDFQVGLTAPAVFDDLVLNGPAGLQTRQFGIVSQAGGAVTFSGSSDGAWAGGVTGTIGDVEYSIQGNVLTGELVVTEAERAFRATAGDLSQRLMAGMEAAAAAGGDGRCSCKPNAPTSCGAPPPNFTKSAHTCFVIVARIGDLDGVCNATQGCANGNYYLVISQQTSVNGIDPVARVRKFYDAWRVQLSGRPDQLRSKVRAAATSAPADGRTRVDFDVQLVDVDGVPLTEGVKGFTVTTQSGSSQIASVGAVVDHGDGSYTFTAVAGAVPGTERFVVVADDGVSPVTLYPYPELRVDPVTRLHAGVERLSADAGGRVPFVVDEPARAGAAYVVLASGAGTSPGQSFGGTTIPLNDDLFFQASLGGANGPLLPASLGLLDATGRAEAAFVAPPGLLAPFVEMGTQHLDWAAVLVGGPVLVSAPVGLELED